jgi:predicted DsbA family dithiol-disulfide isomerase
VTQVVAVTVLTSPWCPFSWAAEPLWRRIQTEFDGRLDVTYVLGDMSARWNDLPGFAASWLEGAARSGQPADPRTLLQDPPASPVPAHLAVRAVAEQADPGPYLRRLRERIALEGFKADRGDALFDLARELAQTRSLDLDRLDIAFRSNGTVEEVAADHERAAGVELPSLSVEGGEPLPDPAAWRGALVAAGAEPGPLPGVLEALQRFERMTTAEVSAVCDLPGPRAPGELWRLALEWRVRPHPVLGGHLWSAGG